MTICAFLNAHFDTNFTNAAELPFHTTGKAFKKGDIITRYEQVERTMYFMNEGIVQLSILKDIEEKIVEFFFTNDFFCSYTSFISQKPSDVQIVALTECQVEAIQYTDLQLAYKTSFFANTLGRLLTEQVYIRKTQREKDFLTKSAEERYKNLISQRPELIQLIPVNKIAKYLGIHPESLSRIRKEIIS
jgi:CRP-like cAMP-binding protein